jgi:hypothetical protein
MVYYKLGDFAVVVKHRGGKPEKIISERREQLSYLANTFSAKAEIEREEQSVENTCCR